MIFSPNRPSLTCETVTICLAAKIGCTSGACTVPKTVMRLVLASSPQAQVIVSSVLPSKSVSPPYPFHRAMGSRNSIPASSAICASFKLFSQEASQRSGTLVTAMPPEQFGEKMPSLSLFLLNIVVRGFCLEPDMSLPSAKLLQVNEWSRNAGLYGGDAGKSKLFCVGATKRNRQSVYSPAGLIASR